MKQITVQKSDLIHILIKNMASHKEEFEGNKKKYLTALQTKLRVARDDVASGKMPDLHFGLPEPTAHTKDYQRAIDMLNMDIEKTVVISLEEYQKYIEDDWDWKFDFNRTNAFYNR